ncbi:MAG TPA: O-antigen ligase family protein [Aggregatilineaceae bacterium]|nr:O-antigen ligase family protein [Aggregatilineaceae bacterium]
MSTLYSLQRIRRNAASWLDRLAFAALLLLAATFALEILRPAFTLGSVQFTNLEALQFLVGGLWIAARCLAPGWRRLPQALAQSVTLWMVVLMASSLAAFKDQTSILIFDSRILRGVLIAWITFDLTRTAERWQAVIRAFALGGIIVYLVGLAEAANIGPVVQGLEAMRGIAIHVGELLRISSTLPYPTITAMVIELTLLPLLVWFQEARQTWRRVLLAIGVLAGLAAFVLTFTRGGWLGLVGGLIVVIVLTLRYSPGHRRLVMAGSAAIVGCLIALIGLLALRRPAVLLRFATENSESWYRVGFEVTGQLAARPGETLTIPVQLTNLGLHPWTISGDNVFHLSYHILRNYPAWRLGILYEGGRTELPGEVPPGNSVRVEASVLMPSEEGDYVIRWDMVQENVTWFSAQNSATADTQVRLSGPPAAFSPDFPTQYFNETVLRPTVTRLELWSVALKMVADHPLLGVGPDNFRRVYDMYATVPFGNTSLHTNSLYVEWLASTGIVGLLAFLWFSGVLLYRAVRSLESLRQHPLVLWQIVLIGSLAAWYVHGVVDYFFEFMPTNTAFWLLVGLVVSAAGVQKMPSRSPERGA